MSFTILLFFVLGLGLLVLGAEGFVRGASRIAAATGVSPLVIGLTVVAFGTSAPEIAVSLRSSLAGQADLALGNVVGSNIANILLVLGISATIAPLQVSQQLIRLDVPILIIISVLTLLVGLDGAIGRLDGTFFVLGVVSYTVFLIFQSRRESAAVQATYAQEFGPPAGASGGTRLKNAGLILGGLVMLVLGANWLVESAVTLAKAFGMSELVVGLTVVAVGTSLPEVATSVIASLRGERDIAVGNVVGSSIFNLLAVLGITAVVTPGGVAVPAAALHFDFPVMIAVTVACLPIFFTGHLIARWEGLLFLGYYAAYTIYLVLESTHHQGLPIFSAVMVAFVIPLTILTLAVVTWRAIRTRTTA